MTQPSLLTIIHKNSVYVCVEWYFEEVREMQWESLGFKGNPFSTEPIMIDTLDLYTGHVAEVSACQDRSKDTHKMRC